jgi:KDO2-lipid IV(A) lauroyltransferase
MAEPRADAAPAPTAKDRRATAIQVLEYGLVRGIFAFFRFIGPDAASWTGGAFMRALGPRLGAVTRRADENLRMAFPDWDERRRRETIAGVWENLGRVAGEFAHLDKFSISGPDARIEIIGAERLKEAAAQGGASIFFSGHFANWELMAVALHQAGIPMAVVYRTANNPLVDRFILKTRMAVMGPTHIPKGRRGARSLVDAMASGVSLAMLVDQKLNDGIAAPLFGRPAMTTPAPARLALKYGAKLFPGRIERIGGARFRITVRPPLELASTGDAEADILAATTSMNAEIEAAARARPDQWLWLHRRWAPPPMGRWKAVPQDLTPRQAQ